MGTHDAEFLKKLLATFAVEAEFEHGELDNFIQIWI